MRTIQALCAPPPPWRFHIWIVQTNPGPKPQASKPAIDKAKAKAKAKEIKEKNGNANVGFWTDISAMFPDEER